MFVFFLIIYMVVKSSNFILNIGCIILLKSFEIIKVFKRRNILNIDELFYWVFFLCVCDDFLFLDSIMFMI